MRFLILMAVALFFVTPVFAQDEDVSTMPASVTECGTPADVTVAPDTGSYCDIYARRMAYAEKRRKLRDSIDARRENFQAPQNAAVSSYTESMNEQYGLDEEGSAEDEADGFDMEDGENDQAVTRQDDTAILE